MDKSYAIDTMRWPPQITGIQFHGETYDVSGLKYTRDIGRPVYIGGNTYYVFGDTFCHNNDGSFVGLSNNTVAHAPDQGNPCMSSYLNDLAHQRTFIPHTKEDEDYENNPLNKRENNRIVNWSFGGIIKDFPESTSGWVFYEKMLTHGAVAGEYFGIGVARVEVQRHKALKVHRVMNDDLIFGPNEPHFGTITHFVEGDYVHILGAKDAPVPTLNLKNHWARIKIGHDFTDHQNYEYLVNTSDGQTWSKQYSLDTLVNVIPALAQGAIIKAPDLTPEGRPYLFLGNSKFPANKVFLACAPDLGGPWEEWEGPEIPNFGGGGLRYCLYPHERSSDLGRGQLRVSWSDDGAQLGGMVVQATIQFAMDGRC